MHHDQPCPPSSAAVDGLDLRGETVGIVAGWGRYPVMVADPKFPGVGFAMQLALRGAGETLHEGPVQLAELRALERRLRDELLPHQAAESET